MTCKVLRLPSGDSDAQISDEVKAEDIIEKSNITLYKCAYEEYNLFIFVK